VKIEYNPKHLDENGEEIGPYFIRLDPETLE
jgi:hypothetical protein